MAWDFAKSSLTTGLSPFHANSWRLISRCALAALSLSSLVVSARTSRTGTGETRVTAAQAEQPLEKLRGVLSRQRLTPLLRSAHANLTYSPDGRYLLLQDDAGIYLLTRSPLRVLGYLDAPNSYPARFAADSQSVVIVSLALTYERRNVGDGQVLDLKVLPIPDGCVDAELSPDGSLLACYRPDFSLAVLELSSGAWIFSDKIHSPDPHTSIILVPLDLDAPFAGAFGFTPSRDMRLLANRAISNLPMSFSPSGSILVAGDVRGALRVDIPGRKKNNLPGALQRLMSGTVALPDETRVLLIPGGAASQSTVRSLADGKVLATPGFTANSVRLASDPRYALLRVSTAQGVRVFDLQDNVPVPAPENIAADAYASELAVVTAKGELLLFRKGEHSPSASVSLPVEGLSPLRGAAVTPGLEEVAIAGDGEAGLFEIATGRKVSNLQQFSAVKFADALSAFLLPSEPRSEPAWEREYLIDRVDAQGLVHASLVAMEATRAAAPQAVWRLDAASGKASPAWTGSETRLRPGGPVFFEYSFEGLAGHGLFLPRTENVPYSRGTRLIEGTAVPFRLRALDPATGSELWSRAFSGLPPVPFADPQGDRLVLSWQADSSGAFAAAKRWATTRDALKKAKPTERDSFLEVADARTGKYLGGVLVQSGNGSATFDSIFSVGDAVIFTRDGVRIHVYSLADGQLKAKLIGIRPVANAQSNLLAVDAGSGHLAIYDLETAAKLDEQMFPDAISYMHFSADGQRLFVLTQNQYAFVLDMAALRQAPTGQVHH